ncbi:PD-(D/E)XK nuclease family protein [Bradyrhizobium sp. CB82]|uniref:PD-(D/E)XK nuclease family protein n=1 Tax=Bradyrhizobium sp. CB82 TaxID=3039159 RepID=UPI0024B07F64|nr:PD-(D/E)XK nuclease family protein [Bradyrhizobium sp. CB82]WFU42732.1 PD-(D/E)XK nuclease family protein [Bradyrhizobium sp. CB82]
MKWSLSAAKTFRKCQREWYFRHCLASPTANDPARRDAFNLGKLQTVAGWRGSVVDDIISRTVVGTLKARKMPETGGVLSEARRIFDMQLDTARKHPLREPDMPVSSWGRSYAALASVEYGDGPTMDEIDRAWTEISEALRNLLRRRNFLERLSAAKILMPQRTLQYADYGVTVVVVPDLVAFYEDEPPAIVDWKTHAVGTSDAWLQLAIYSSALRRCKPHKDFPEAPSARAPDEIRLVEVQLLLDRMRRHELDDEDRASADDYIAESATAMLAALDGRKGHELAVEDFPASPFETVCENCVFKRICWERQA